MCGIAGIVSVHTVPAASIASTMVAGLAHRGPDGNGVHSVRSGDWNISLGHTRLAILDLSRHGSQPMRGQAGSVITFNGEIYNFRTLREELTAHGVAFRSTSDTEVVLAAYERWGVAAFSRFRGMFALAIWDGRLKSLILARDTFGIKPLYFHRTDKQVVFASEVRSLLATGLVSRRLSREGVESFLAYGAVQEPHTIVEGIESLLPGRYIRVDLSSDRLGYTEELIAEPTRKPPSAVDYKHAVAAVCNGFLDSVKSHLVSDVPVGIFLSGGIDSSAIVAAASQVGNSPPRTFSVVFPSEPDVSERQYSRVVAKRFNTCHTEIEISDESILSFLREAFAAMDQPTIDGVNTYIVSKAVRSSGIKVALSGLGSDEMFGGYASFSRLQRIIGFRSVLRPLAPLFRRTNALPLPSRLWKTCHVLACEGSATGVYEASRALFVPREIEALGFRGMCSVSKLQEAEGDPIAALSSCELSRYVTNTLLRDSDVMSMSLGLEIRVPFLHRTFCDLVLALPGKWKGRGPVPKRLLIDALHPLLTEEVWRRPKRGFTLPFDRWLTGTLAADVGDTLCSVGRLNEIGLNSASVMRVWQSARSGAVRSRWTRAWALYALVKWCVINGFAPYSTPVATPAEAAAL